MLYIIALYDHETNVHVTTEQNEPQMAAKYRVGSHAAELELKRKLNADIIADSLFLNLTPPQQVRVA